jgi:DNA-binding LytR/AlgR family response regulator
MNVLIVEDEIKTAELLKELIEGQQDYLVASIQDSIEGTLSYLSKNKDNIDLMFLDIQLADGLSFEIFNHIKLNIPVVFCTAFDEYLLQAFKSNGVDYILKPFEDDEIIGALNKIKKFKTSLSKDSTNNIEKIKSLFSETKSYQKSIIVHVGEKLVPIDINDILLFHLENETIMIYCSDNKKYYIFKRLDEIEKILDSKLFFRINRQMIINRNAVTEIEPFFNRKVIVKTNIPLPEKAIVSRLKVKPFLSWLEKPT